MTIDETIAFIKGAHADQLDKGGHPYWMHPLRVADRFFQTKHATEDGYKAALLHDVIEDTEITSLDLAMAGFSPRTIALVISLTRDRGDGRTYMQWIGDLASSRDAELIQIKLADNEDNSDPARIAQLPETERGIARRYAKAREILLRGLESAQ